ncbi:MAG: Hsp20 family protein [Sphingobacterium sp.]
MTSTINTPKEYQRNQGIMEIRNNQLKIPNLYLLNKEDVQTDGLSKVNNAPIRISENEEYYQVELFASARQRANFKVTLKGQQLKISCSPHTLNDFKQGLMSPAEQQLGAIERLVTLEKPIVNNRVFASYENDILTVILQIQKNDEEYEHQISVS